MRHLWLRALIAAVILYLTSTALNFLTTYGMAAAANSGGLDWLDSSDMNYGDLFQRVSFAVSFVQLGISVVVIALVFRFGRGDEKPKRDDMA
jgi:hypothetical protein